MLNSPSLSDNNQSDARYSTQLVLTCSKLTVETLEQGVIYVQS